MQKRGAVMFAHVRSACSVPKAGAIPVGTGLPYVADSRQRTSALNAKPAKAAR